MNFGIFFIMLEVLYLSSSMLFLQLTEKNLHLNEDVAKFCHRENNGTISRIFLLRWDMI